MSPRERDPIANDTRKAARRRRRGATACAVCGATDPEALVAVGRTLLEFHHVAGAANDPEAGAWVCRNCHAIATEGQLDAGADLRHDDGRHFLERVEAALRSLGSFLALLADRFMAWADGLAEVIAALDAAIPNWRIVTQVASR